MASWGRVIRSASGRVTQRGDSGADAPFGGCFGRQSVAPRYGAAIGNRHEKQEDGLRLLMGVIYDMVPIIILKLRGKQCRATR